MFLCEVLGSGWSCVSGLSRCAMFPPHPSPCTRDAGSCVSPILKAMLPDWLRSCLFGQVMRRKGNLGALSGADGSRYMEYESKPPAKKHPLFKARFMKLA